MKDAPTRQHDAALRFAIPPADHLIRCFIAAAIVLATFVVVYGGADYVTSLRDPRVRVDFHFEQNLPFVPESTLVYSSLYLMFLVIPFVLRSRSEIWRFVSLMVLITVVAGLFFLVIPAELRFETPTNLGRFPTAFQLADSINLTYNLCPSLHVAYAVLCADVIRRKKPRGGWLFHIWALGIAISAWLSYQHHLLDLVAGYLLSLAAIQIFMRRAGPLAGDTR